MILLAPFLALALNAASSGIAADAIPLRPSLQAEASGETELTNPAVPDADVVEGPSRASILTEKDLAPYLAAGSGPSIAKAFHEGRYSAALLLLQKMALSPPLKYLAAICLSRLGRSEEAASAFAALALVELPLAGRCHFHAGLAEEDLKNWRAAAEHYALVEPHSVLWEEAQLGIARVERAQGDSLAALGALAPLANRATPNPGRDISAEALFSIAQLSLARGDKDSARAALLKLWSEHPLTHISDQALIQAQGLGVKDPGAELKLTRAEILEASHRNDEALAALKPLVATLPFPSELGCRARFTLAKTLRKERHHPEALAAFEPVLSQCKDPALLARALYIAGSSASFTDKPRGVVLYDRLASDYPDHPFADDALFFAADLDEKLGDDDAALAELEKLANHVAYRDGDFRPEGLFRLFWLERKRGQLPEAMGVLDRILIEYGTTRPAETERAEYWRGQILLQMDRPSESLAALERVAVAHPTSFYGLLARSRLAERDPAVAKRVDAEVRQTITPLGQPYALGALAADPHFQAGVELMRLGLSEDAATELLAVPRTQIGAADPAATRTLVLLLARAGDDRAAQAIARTELHGDLDGVPTPERMDLWRAAFPLAFRPAIQKSCDSAHVDPDLFQALIREESALDPHALSWAGAVGLSQLMVPTARQVARQLNLKGHIDAVSLQQPELNLRIGSTYVGQLLKKFGGNPVLALAAYNAGAGAVTHWMSGHELEDLDAFVEEIPVAETRGYVKRVLQSFTTYQLLYGASAETHLPAGLVAATASKAKALGRRAPRN